MSHEETHQAPRAAGVDPEGLHLRRHRLPLTALQCLERRDHAAGARQIGAGHISLGDFVMFTTFLAFLIAPVFQAVGIGTQLTEAFAGLDRTREVLGERQRERVLAGERKIGN